MKTEQELNAAILRMTLIIAELSPELSKYIAEMPVQLSGLRDQKAYLGSLQDYYESLEDTLRKYDAFHPHVAMAAAGLRAGKARRRAGPFA
jgi:hypothetical protein